MDLNNNNNNNKKQMNLYENRNKLTDIENKLMVTKEERGE